MNKNQSHQSVDDDAINRGKKLATTYCQSCHLLPAPSLLDSKTWESGVLPEMGPRLGIFNYNGKHYPSYRNDMLVDRNFYPSKPVMSLQDWQDIIDYYTALSPDTLAGQQRQYTVQNNANLFKLESPAAGKSLPTTCFVQIDTSGAKHQVIVSDMLSKNVYLFSDQLQLLDSFKNASPAVDLEIQKGIITTCNIGVMNPNNGKYGSSNRFLQDAKGKITLDTSLNLAGLARPVQVTPADFNGDGKMDYLVCEYGNLTGALVWMENTGNNTFERHVLRALPGAIKASIKDVNHDNLPDIYVLFAQGDEGIFLFTNKGHGAFEQKQLLQFPPINGSSYFELADFNKDGAPDILYTCGDNADFSAVLKPYHGIYIFINDGSNHFSQQYFFAMHGCFKAMARDFDGDGDLDIAAISFFADYVNHPQESFIYLENKSNFDFHPYSVAGTEAGRWLTMDAGDIDGDGKTDLVLGNFSIAPVSVKGSTNWKEGPPFLVLKNLMKK